MNHFKVTLKAAGRQMTLYFSQGYGISGEPTHDECLIAWRPIRPAWKINLTGFEDWACDLGYDPDSRKAEKIFKTICKQAERLKKFLGEDLYKILLWDTEGL